MTHFDGGDRRADELPGPRSAPAARVNRALLILTVSAAALYGWGLARGNAHYYYRAAVRGMSEDWSNFAFGALDPAGSITLDKLPGAFWVQALAVRVLGYHDRVLLLPGALAATAAVPVLYLTVRRWTGELAGVVAAVFLLVGPVAFAAARVNLADPLLMFLLVAAAYVVTRAIDGSPRWLIVAAVAVGAAFQVKMLQSWLVLPGFVAAYAVGTPAPPRARLRRLCGFVAGTVALSLSWMVVVALIPAAQRPYLDGSSTNSPWQMVFSYNGFSRAGGDEGPMAVPFGGAPGPLRLLGEQFGGQIGWMLPFAVVVAAAGAVLAGRTPARTAGWVLWGGWLFVAGASISATSGGHPYYAIMLAPAVAALAAGGLVALATEAGYRRHSDLVLLSALVVAAVTGAILAGRVRSVPWTTPLVVVIAILTVLAAAAVLLRRTATQVTVAVVIAVAAGPTAWIVASPAVPPASVLTVNPVAGPPTTPAVYGTETGSAGLTMMFGTPPGSPPPPVSTPLLGTTPDRALLEFLERAHGGEKYLFAAGDASSAAAYVAAGYSVLPMGGFTASMPYPTPADLRRLVESRQLRFVSLIPMPGGDGPSGARQAWVTDHCAPVDPRASGATYTVLYDCAVAHTP